MNYSGFCYTFGTLTLAQIEANHVSMQRSYASARARLRNNGYGRRLRQAPLMQAMARQREESQEVLLYARSREPRLLKLIAQINKERWETCGAIEGWREYDRAEIETSMALVVRQQVVELGGITNSTFIPGLTTNFQKIDHEKWPHMETFVHQMRSTQRNGGRTWAFYASMLRANASLREWINEHSVAYRVVRTNVNAASHEYPVYKLVLVSEVFNCACCSELISSYNSHQVVIDDEQDTHRQICTTCHSGMSRTVTVDPLTGMYFNRATVTTVHLEDYGDVMLHLNLRAGRIQVDVDGNYFKPNVGAIGQYHGAPREWYRVSSREPSPFRGHFGVELEVAFSSSARYREFLNKHVNGEGRFLRSKPFLVERDGSLESLPNGCEFISEPLPLHEGYQAADAPWRWLLKELYDHTAMGWKYRMLAGIHVNMDASDKTPNQILRYASFITNCSALSKFIAGRRSIYGFTSEEHRPPEERSAMDEDDDDRPTHPDDLDEDDYSDGDEYAEAVARARRQYQRWERRLPAPDVEALDTLYKQPLSTFAADDYAGATGGFAKVPEYSSISSYTNRGKYAPVHVRGGVGNYVLETRIFGSNIKYEGFMACVEYCAAVMTFVCALVSDVDVLDVEIADDFMTWLAFRTDAYPNLAARLGIVAFDKNPDADPALVAVPVAFIEPALHTA